MAVAQHGGTRTGEGFRPVRVDRLRRLTQDTVELTLVGAPGGADAEAPAAPFAAGAHVKLDFGGGLMRCYSLCNVGDLPGRYVVAVKREPRSTGGSAAAHALEAGAALRVSHPISQFEPDWGEPRLLLVAGGIGITPIYAMAQEAVRRGHDFVLHYFVRDAGEAAYLDEIRALAGPHRLRLHAGLDPAAVRDRVVAMLADPVAGQGVYVCGPRPLIDLVRGQAAACLPPERIHWESFGSDGAAAAAGAADGDDAFEIALASGEGPFQVAPGQSALAVLLAAGIDLPFSCREGECGMCVVDVVEGEPDHRDHFLSEDMRARNSCMALCVSRARSRKIVIDF